MFTSRFRRRIYQNLSEFASEFGFLVRNRKRIRQTMHNNQVNPAFRERLMLVVTQVNNCRYCRSFHSQLAQEAGIPDEELRQLLMGLIPPDAPTEELGALVYARHWAENNAMPDPEAVQRLIAQIGQEKADAIHLLLRMIRMGNLLGNTGDYWLYRLSFGRLGLLPEERNPEAFP